MKNYLAKIVGTVLLVTAGGAYAQGATANAATPSYKPTVDDWVGVKMTLTTPGCGMSGMISQNVRNRVLKVPGVKEADVRIVWDPAWSPARMSPAAKKKLGMNT